MREPCRGFLIESVGFAPRKIKIGGLIAMSENKYNLSGSRRMYASRHYSDGSAVGPWRRAYASRWENASELCTCCNHPLVLVADIPAGVHDDLIVCALSHMTFLPPDSAHVSVCTVPFGLLRDGATVTFDRHGNC